MTSEEFLIYDPHLLIRKLENDKELFIYTYNVNTKHKNHILTVPGLLNVNILDSKTAIIINGTKFEIIDIENKEIIQTLELNDSRVKFFDIWSIKYLTYPLINMREKSTQYLLIGLKINNNYTSRVYKYENRRLTQTAIEIKEYREYDDAFFSGDKYLVSKEKEEFPSYKIWDLNTGEIKKIVLGRREGKLIENSYNTLLAVYIKEIFDYDEEEEEVYQREEIYFEEIDPESGQVLRKIEPRIPNCMEYIIKEDHNNKGEYIIFLNNFLDSGMIKRLFVFRSSNKKVYFIKYIDNQIEMCKIEQESLKNIRERANIKSFKYLGNGILLLSSVYVEKDRKQVDIIYNIDRDEPSMLLSRKSNDAFVGIISNKEILYLGEVVEIHDGLINQFIPFLLNTEKSKMRNKIMNLIKNNFISNNIKGIISNFI